MRKKLARRSFPRGGDLSGSGIGRFHLYPMKNKLCYLVTVSAPKAHLHMGDAEDEEGGSVKLNFLPLKNSARGLGERFIKRSRATLRVTTSTSTTRPSRTAP